MTSQLRIRVGGSHECPKTQKGSTFDETNDLVSFQKFPLFDFVSFSLPLPLVNNFLEWAGVILSPEDAACAISDIDGRELYGQELRITHASQRDRSIFNLLPPEPSENLPSRKRPREEEDEGNYDPSYGMF